MNTFQLIQAAARATFRDMTDEDFDAFNGAPAGSQMAEVGDEMVIIFVPEGAGDHDGDYLEFHGGFDATPWCVSLAASRLM